MPDLAHEAICTVAAWHIRKHSVREHEWRYTRLLHLHDELKTIALLEPKECLIVSCYIDRDRWFMMTSARLITCGYMKTMTVSPLDIAHWYWGNFKSQLEPRIGIAKVSMKDGTSFSFPYETGYAAMAPIYYERFWAVKYPVLHNLDIARIRGQLLAGVRMSLFNSKVE